MTSERAASVAYMKKLARAYRAYMSWQVETACGHLHMRAIKFSLKAAADDLRRKRP